MFPVTLVINAVERGTKRESMVAMYRDSKGLDTDLLEMNDGGGLCTE